MDVDVDVDVEENDGLGFSFVVGRIVGVNSFAWTLKPHFKLASSLSNSLTRASASCVFII